MYIFAPVFKIQVMRINSLYYKQNINIAFPIMLSLAGQAIVQMADNIMVGQLGAPELAAVSLAGAIIMNTMVVGMGIATGLTPLVGQAHALDDKERIAGFFQNSLLLNTTVSLVLIPFLVHAHALPFHDGTTRRSCRIMQRILYPDLILGHPVHPVHDIQTIHGRNWKHEGSHGDHDFMQFE